MPLLIVATSGKSRVSAQIKFLPIDHRPLAGLVDLQHGRCGAARGLQTGLAWALKIITDPVHDIKMYYKSPYYLLRGEWMDPMDHVRTSVH